MKPVELVARNISAALRETINASLSAHWAMREAQRFEASEVLVKLTEAETALEDAKAAIEKITEEGRG